MAMLPFISFILHC